MPVNSKVFQTAGRTATRLFLRIEEPRVIRVFHFIIYIVFAGTGLALLLRPAPVLVGVLGPLLVDGFAASLFVGGAIGAGAVLPGVWWAERLAIISLISGLLVYLVISFALDTQPLRIGMIVGVILFMALRWIEVRKFQHAPGK